MKRKSNFTLLSLALITMLFNFAHKDAVRNTGNIDKFALKGDVKEVVETSYIPIKEEGKITKDKKVAITTQREDVSLMIHPVFSFDEEGFLLELVHKDFAEGVVSRYVPKYDKNRTQSEQENYGHNDSLISKFIFEVNKKGNITKQSTVTPNDVVLSIINLIYDKKENVIEEQLYDDKKQLISTVKRVFNQKGEKNYELSFNADGMLIRKQAFEYNDVGQVIKINELNKDDVVEFITTQKYDQQGNIIEQIVTKNTTGDKVSNSYQYEYDKNGNWVEKVVFRNKIPNMIVTREITYHSEKR